MAKVSLNTIKSWFQTAKKPTQGQFSDTFDSFYHKDEKLRTSDVERLDNILNNKLDTDQFDGHVYRKDNPHEVTAEQIGLGNIQQQLDDKVSKDDSRLHDHDNLDVLDQIDEDEEGAPTWNGEPWPCIGDSSRPKGVRTVNSYNFDAQRYGEINVVLPEYISEAHANLEVAGLAEGITIINLLATERLHINLNPSVDWVNAGMYPGGPHTIRVDPSTSTSLRVYNLGGNITYETISKYPVDKDAVIWAEAYVKEAAYGVLLELFFDEPTPVPLNNVAVGVLSANGTGTTYSGYINIPEGITEYRGIIGVREPEFFVAGTQVNVIAGNPQGSRYMLYFKHAYRYIEALEENIISPSYGVGHNITDNTTIDVKTAYPVASQQINVIFRIEYEIRDAAEELIPHQQELVIPIPMGENYSRGVFYLEVEPVGNATITNVMVEPEMDETYRYVI